MWIEITRSRPVISKFVGEDCVFCFLVQALCIDSEYCVSNEGKCLLNLKAKHLTHIFQKCIRWLCYHLWTITGPFTERWLSSDDQTWESCAENEGIELRVCLYNMCFLSVSLCVWDVCVCVCACWESEIKSGPLYSTLSVLRSPWWVMLAWHWTELRQTDFIIKMLFEYSLLFNMLQRQNVI